MLLRAEVFSTSEHGEAVRITRNFPAASALQRDPAPYDDILSGVLHGYT
jgi:hypothetical protein